MVVLVVGIGVAAEAVDGIVRQAVSVSINKQANILFIVIGIISLIKSVLPIGSKIRWWRAGICRIFLLHIIFVVSL